MKFERETECARITAPLMTTVALTEPQRRALTRLAKDPYVTPAEIGFAMCPDRNPPLKCQGAGRVGGSMAKRLIDLGLAQDCSFLHWGFPAYRITGAGRKALTGATP